MGEAGIIRALERCATAESDNGPVRHRVRRSQPAIALGVCLDGAAMSSQRTWVAILQGHAYLSPMTATADTSIIMPTKGRLCTVMDVLAGKLPSGQNSWRMGMSGSSSLGSVR